MKQQWHIWFVSLGVVSFLCLIAGGIGIVLGEMIPSDQMTRFGVSAADVGLVGVPLFSLLCAQCQKDKGVTVSLLNVLRRASRHHHS